MKNLRTAVLCAGIALCSLGSFAQEKPPVPVNEPDHNKPRLFAGLPDQIQLSTDELSSLFSIPLGRGTSLRLADDNRFQFEGELVSSGTNNDNNQQSLVVRSTNFNGASLTLSRITNADGSVVYRGRIISFRHGDLYVLENREGRYMLVKKNFYDLVNE